MVRMLAVASGPGHRVEWRRGSGMPATSTSGPPRSKAAWCPSTRRRAWSSTRSCGAVVQAWRRVGDTAVVADPQPQRTDQRDGPDRLLRRVGSQSVVVRRGHLPRRGWCGGCGAGRGGVARGAAPRRRACVVRDLPSLHQLLPDYACIDHGGARHRLDEISVPELETAMVTDAMAFHTDLPRGFRTA